MPRRNKGVFRDDIEYVMNALEPLRQQAEISRRYAAARSWVGEQADLQSAMVCRASLRLQPGAPLSAEAFDAFESIRGTRGKAPFTEVFEAAHAAVMTIYAGANGAVDEAQVARADALVSLFEGACAAQGYRPFRDT